MNTFVVIVCPSWILHECGPLTGSVTSSLFILMMMTSQERGRIEVNRLMPGCAEMLIFDVSLDDVGFYSCESQNLVSSDVQETYVDVGCKNLFLPRGDETIASRALMLFVFGWKGRTDERRYFMGQVNNL